MWQRFITGTLLTLFLITVLILGGYVFGAVAFVVCGLCVYEELQAMKQGGHRPLSWPVFAALFACAPLMLFVRPLAIVPVLMLTCIFVIFAVMRRETPDLTDVMVSLLPLLTIVLPGLCLISLSTVTPRPMQALMTTMVFSVSVGSDVFALFTGTWIGGKKLCPQISPKKTVSGAIGGLIGATGLTVLAGTIFSFCYPQMSFPPLWAFAVVGFVGGVTAQFGDMLASLVKRYCKVKDFGSLFPGHGGMLDRMDSILFASVVIFCLNEILRYLA
ncbi:MAG: phosphatidate cytidylyltransferase [Bacillota bacterium]